MMMMMMMAMKARGRSSSSLRSLLSSFQSSSSSFIHTSSSPSLSSSSSSSSFIHTSSSPSPPPSSSSSSSSPSFISSAFIHTSSSPSPPSSSSSSSSSPSFISSAFIHTSSSPSPPSSSSSSSSSPSFISSAFIHTSSSSSSSSLSPPSFIHASPSSLPLPSPSSPSFKHTSSSPSSMHTTSSSPSSLSSATSPPPPPPSLWVRRESEGLRDCFPRRRRGPNWKWHSVGQLRFHIGHPHHSHNHEGEEEGEKNPEALIAGERVTRWGFAADIMLAGSKGFAGYLSGSTAVIADAAHSLSDIVLSGIALWLFKAARAPKDEQHPYGHGKFETMGALALSFILILTGSGIAWHAFEVLQALLLSMGSMDLSSSLHAIVDQIPTFAHSHEHGHHHGGHHHAIDMEHMGVALGVTVLSISVKEGLFWVTKKAGEAHGSELLKANAWHHRTDAISSLVALLGVGGAMAGLPLLDPLAGLLVSGLIVKAGLQTGYRSVQELVDSAIPDSVLSPIQKTVLAVKGVQGCYHLRGRKAGSLLHLDANIQVDPRISISEAHNIEHAVREHIKRNHHAVDEIFVHIEPGAVHSPRGISDSVGTAEEADVVEKNGQDLQDSYYRHPEVEKDVQQLLENEFFEVMSFRRLTCHFVQGKLTVEIEVSMKPDISIRSAMRHAADVEKRISLKFPEISAVHMQLPLKKDLAFHKE